MHSASGSGSGSISRSPLLVNCVDLPRSDSASASASLSLSLSLPPLASDSDSASDSSYFHLSSPSPDSSHSFDLTPHRWNFYFFSFPRFLPYHLFAAFFLSTFAQELPASAISLILNREIGFSSSEINEIYGLWYLPGSFRLVFALLSDQFPLFGYRRKSYLAIALLVALIFSFFLGSETFSPSSHGSTFVIFGVFLYFSESFAETILDSMAVEVGNAAASQAINKWAKLDPQTYSTSRSLSNGPGSSEDSDRRVARNRLVTAVKAKVQSESMAVRSAGSLIASAVSIGLAKCLTNRAIVLVSGSFFFLLLLISWLIRESPTRVGFLGLTAVSENGKLAFAGNIKTEAEEANNANSASEQSSDGDIGGVLYGPLVTSSTHTIVESDASPALASALPIPVSLTPRRFLFSKLLQLREALFVLWRPVLFILVYSCTPSSADTYSSYLSLLPFDPWQFSLSNFVSLIGGLTGTIFFWRFLSHFEMRRVFIPATLLSAAADCLVIVLVSGYNRALGMTDFLFVCVSGFISSFFASVAFMPSLVLAAQHAPKRLGLEGSMFSAFQMAVHLGQLLSAFISAKLTDTFQLRDQHWGGMSHFVLICALLSLLPLPLVPVLLKQESSEEAAAAVEQDEKRSEPITILQTAQSADRSIAD